MNAQPSAYEMITSPEQRTILLMKRSVGFRIGSTQATSHYFPNTRCFSAVAAGSSGFTSMRLAAPVLTPR